MNSTDKHPLFRCSFEVYLNLWELLSYLTILTTQLVSPHHMYCLLGKHWAPHQGMFGQPISPSLRLVCSRLYSASSLLDLCCEEGGIEGELLSCSFTLVLWRELVATLLLRLPNIFHYKRILVGHLWASLEPPLIFSRDKALRLETCLLLIPLYSF